MNLSEPTTWKFASGQTNSWGQQRAYAIVPSGAPMFCAWDIPLEQGVPLVLDPPLVHMLWILCGSSWQSTCWTCCKLVHLILRQWDPFDCWFPLAGLPTEQLLPEGHPLLGAAAWTKVHRLLVVAASASAYRAHATMK